MKIYFIIHYLESIKKIYIKPFQVPTVTVLVTYSFSTIIDEAPPPPLQMAATPFCPGLRA
jgi:hypothetical protein